MMIDHFWDDEIDQLLREPDAEAQERHLARYDARTQACLEVVLRSRIEQCLMVIQRDCAKGGKR